MALGGIPPAYSVNLPTVQPSAAPIRQDAAPSQPAGGNNGQRVPGDPASNSRGPVRNMDTYQCQTCKNRKYQDGSDDPGVSYKTPTKISANSAASAVRSHEQEHVTREQSAARREDREVVSQSVSIHTAICAECGKTYVSGGTTRTVTRAQADTAARYQVGQAQNDPSAGQTFSAEA